MNASLWIALETQLLSKADLRAQLRMDPSAVARDAGLNAAEEERLRSLDLEALERQARSLVNKRMNEVAEILPVTRSRLASRWRDTFHRYAAEQAWPAGHIRHWRDAAAFARWLLETKIERPDSREMAWAEFMASNSRFRLRLVSEHGKFIPHSMRMLIFYRNTRGHTQAHSLRIG